MAGPTEFSLEAVRQYMLGRDGQVSHHNIFLTITISFYYFHLVH